ncbi:DNA polymerase ligase N-terminal domain-containing protein [Bailinhaonella thermotolerans]|uniref:ATP-dependent DNA ligase n=1 Tax=Bailinhaonella thermotolerans TaxID=1070861 RepID=A0A3A4AT68_9ACTN|nr:DNA polymerase ligase N-terminal domain-containing protein [Bailinhaonella thermotolerans]RJL32553.1 ATP-dependent DNA ligase [Bailinhaonella thermotolerans]
MADRLVDYRRKRDPEKTPEPVPRQRGRPGRGDTFVIQEHHARALHWDLRLERDGVLVSWAVPKGLPPDPKVNHLAVHTEDHPMEYASFEGEIPAGEYGGGQVRIWDRGTYETEKWSDREVKFVLHGERSEGRYVLFRTRGKNWMIHRMDGPAPGWEPMPAGVSPMTPVRRARLPRNPGRYAFEFAWEGRRGLAAVEGGRLTLRDPAGEDITERWLRPLGGELGSRSALLDGVIAEVEGVEVYVVFDLLYAEGRALLAEPFDRRRSLLEELGIGGARWQTAPSFPGEGAAVRAAARERGLPAVIAKRRDSPYIPGESDAWLCIPI